MKKHRIKISHKLLFQIVGYNIAGLAFFAASMAGLALSFYVFKIDLFWAKVIGNILGLSVNYVIERYWVFKRSNAKKRSAQEAIRYWVLSFANFWIDIMIVLGLNSAFKIEPVAASVVASWFFTVWNFLWYKYWVFPEYKTIRRSPRKSAAKRKTAMRRKPA